MKTNGDILREQAEKAGIPLRTLDEVKADLIEARANKCEAEMASLMFRHGRMTDEARAFLKAIAGK